MSIKAGQSFWEGPKVNSALASELDDDGRIPHSAALPAVARWLAEHGDDALMTFAYHWLNSGDDGRFPQTDGAARSLIAALTEATR